MTKTEELLTCIQPEYHRQALLVIYVMGLLEEMVEIGVVQGGTIGLSDKAKLVFAEIREDPNFKPTDEEVESTLASIIREDQMNAALANLPVQ